jgi:hypothetical protein
MSFAIILTLLIMEQMAPDHFTNDPLSQGEMFFEMLAR